MTKKLEQLFKDLNDGHMISLYKNRVMINKSGAGEIQFWELRDENEENETLCLFNDGVKIVFTDYEIIKSSSDKYDSIKLKYKDTEICTLKFPLYNRIMQNHNTFYVEEFALKMEDVLQQAIGKGDWADKTKLKELTDGIKSNLSKIKTTNEQMVIIKSCIDIANYAMMIYYLYGIKV